MRSKLQAEFFSRVRDIESFKLLLDLIPDVGFFVKDLKGRVVMFNRRACEICNLNNEMEVHGKTDYDLFPKEQADLYVEVDREVMRTGRPIINAVEPGPEASKRLVIYSKIPVYGRNNKVIGVAGIHRFIESTRDAPDWYGRFSETVNHLHHHYAEPFNLADFARRAKVSESQLERRFTKLLGCTPSDYVTRIRIDAARELLENTDRTMTDIAQAVGFYDNSHFTHIFKRLRGCTPKQYRAAHARAAKGESAS